MSSAARPTLSVCPSAPANDAQAAELDAGIARALERMQRDPDHRWTVGALAKIAFASRAAFARRFVVAVGVPPLAWLTAVRVARAAKRLCTSADPVATIALEVGYANAFAFGRAFKRVVGLAPTAFRRGERTRATVALLHAGRAARGAPERRPKAGAA